MQAIPRKPRYGARDRAPGKRDWVWMSHVNSVVYDVISKPPRHHRVGVIG
ncbi:hypothetical protein [Hyphomicrobium sp.]|nr:hypothetical protein [Hyphomicrobium sp.]HET6389371.1 hypothetical protein [Hyphomicrobium sp.]